MEMLLPSLSRSPPTTQWMTLKKAIKAEKAVSFSDVDADMLTLWSVSIPVSDDDDDDDEVPIYINNIPKDDKKKLKATTRLSKVFDTEMLEDTIHIIVQRPPPGNAPLLYSHNMFIHSLLTASNIVFHVCSTCHSSNSTRCPCSAPCSQLYSILGCFPSWHAIVG